MMTARHGDEHFVGENGPERIVPVEHAPITTPTPIPVHIRIGPADCHNAEAVTLWQLTGDELRLCYHCTNRHRATMTDKGWELIREYTEHLGL